ncbi:AbrB/MazE/SpoVT family DNA-binding domain-containing protein [Candidatus Woesearchaeota archaeon]|nr:AbrB/MazE/SpoVT family DNA-binding domain-containing protein [Candidatus Woesearchaeota archaeon]
MIKATGRIRAWGNSFGIVLPKDELKAENLGVNDEVEIIVKRKENPLRAAFGFLKNAKPKTTKSTDELLKEIDEELDSRYDEL